MPRHFRTWKLFGIQVAIPRVSHTFLPSTTPYIEYWLTEFVEVEQSTWYRNTRRWVIPLKLTKRKPTRRRLKTWRKITGNNSRTFYGNSSQRKRILKYLTWILHGREEFWNRFRNVSCVGVSYYGIFTRHIRKCQRWMARVWWNQ